MSGNLQDTQGTAGSTAGERREAGAEPGPRGCAGGGCARGESLAVAASAPAPSRVFSRGTDPAETPGTVGTARRFDPGTAHLRSVSVFGCVTRGWGVHSTPQSRPRSRRAWARSCQGLTFLVAKRPASGVGGLTAVGASILWQEGKRGSFSSNDIFLEKLKPYFMKRSALR